MLRKEHQKAFSLFGKIVTVGKAVRSTCGKWEEKEEEEKEEEEEERFLQE